MDATILIAGTNGTHKKCLVINESKLKIQNQARRSDRAHEIKKVITFRSFPLLQTSMQRCQATFYQAIPQTLHLVLKDDRLIESKAEWMSVDVESLSLEDRS